MLKVGKWLNRSQSSSSIGSNNDAVIEAQNMEIALKAAELIMNDDIVGAEKQLANGDSAFHKLAQGTIGFLKATLGFERDAMRDATTTLNDAETAAGVFYQKAQQDPRAIKSTIYSKGSEFALCQAEAQIMNAVVAVLNENLTESLKGFYKLRKAYLTLDGLAQQEAAFMKRGNVARITMSRQASSQSIQSVRSFQSGFSVGQRLDSRSALNSPQIMQSVWKNTSAYSYEKKEKDSDPDDSDEFFEAEAHQSTTKEGELSAKPSHDSLHSGLATPIMELPLDRKPSLLTADADSELFANSLDVFIHSGVNLMSGLINLMLSVIPPTFGRLLSIIGFRGDRERGLKMLWQASKFANVNGGMAALILFGWYNGIIGFCDIITDSDPDIKDDVNGFPLERLEGLLANMRTRYPKSFLWKLEEARSFSSRRQIQKALDILCKPEKAQMKQLEALHQFEKAIDAANAHQYELCAEAFLACCDLNEWSQALYYYAVAAAHVQMYRDLAAANGDSSAIKKHRSKAHEYFKLAPTAVGKKKMLGRQLPFDTFVTKKIAKWQGRATAWNCEFIDAVGVAPIEEVIMLWNGYKKMNVAQLNKSLANVAWSSNEAYNLHWELEDDNERAIQSVLTAIPLRNLRRHDEARAALQPVIDANPASFKGSNKDDWMGPTAHYEMAANYWMQRQEYTRRYGATIAGAGDDTGQVSGENIRSDKQLVMEARKHIDTAKAWGAYTLDTRIGMKVTAGHAAISKWQARHTDV